VQALLIFPHQLFASNAVLAKALGGAVYMVEDFLFFEQYRFHQQKLVLHRASMRAHADYLRAQKIRVEYLDRADCPTLLMLFERLAGQQITRAHYIDLVDDWLQQHLHAAAIRCTIGLTPHRSDMFLSEPGLLEAHFAKSSMPRMARFYMDQRRRNDILMDGDLPAGGRWSFDEDNRKRLPRGYSVPPAPSSASNPYVEEAQHFVNMNFADNPGQASPFCYPVTYQDARAWLEDFLTDRLAEFGDYEDAMSQQHAVLFHSVLTPSLNIGLLTPREVIEAALARRACVPINCLEGFVRQVVGWREYMRGAYASRGRRQRSRNFWNHTRRIPASFWSGTTGIAPVDAIIRKLLNCAYAHHIERLMVLSNFMLLCEFHPDEVYRWFMEMFIDAYDWVMVPNVYGMAQYADGDGITTKPYISGSNYILKMSDYQRGPWCAVWDALYWRFVAVHREQFASNRRTQVMVLGWDRMAAAKRALHLETAENFLQGLTAQAATA
jgi:deoxyribodipyrimidine photolyase-related protein